MDQMDCAITGTTLTVLVCVDGSTATSANILIVPVVANKQIKQIQKLFKFSNSRGRDGGVAVTSHHHHDDCETVLAMTRPMNVLVTSDQLSSDSLAQGNN